MQKTHCVNLLRKTKTQTNVSVPSAHMNDYMCLGKDALGDLLKFCRKDLKVSKLETILRIEIANKLNFKIYNKTLCSKASYN